MAKNRTSDGVAAPKPGTRGMRRITAVLLLNTCAIAHAELPYKLPPGAKYTATAEDIDWAKSELTKDLVGDSTKLSNLFPSHVLCGPGLWHILSDSAHFAKPLVAKSTVKVPLGNGAFQELPIALLQSPDEVDSFRKALADLLRSQGKLKIREPTEDEFTTYWAVIPYDNIPGPLLVGDGKDSAILCQFWKGKIYWIDEVKRMRIRK